MTYLEFIGWIEEMIEQLPSGINREVNPEDDGSDDASADLGGFIWQECQRQRMLIEHPLSSPPTPPPIIPQVVIKEETLIKTLKEDKGLLGEKGKREKIGFVEMAGFTNLTPHYLNFLTAKFPAISIASELSRMEAWLDANPKNRKSNYKRFITNWLTRAQDKAPRIEQRTGFQNLADPPIDPLDKPYAVTCKTCKRPFKMTKRLWSASTFERTGECQECYDRPE